MSTIRRLDQRRGSVGIIVGVIVVVVLGLGVFYLVSAPFQTSVDQMTSQATEWTPENIQANPVGYLTWALKKTGETENRLEAGKLSLTTKRNEAKRKLEPKLAEQTSAQKLFAEARDAYREAEAADSWPATIRGKTYDEGALKGFIVQGKSKLDNVKRMITTYEQMRDRIGAKLNEVESKLSEVQQLKGKLGTDLEIAKANRAVDDIGNYQDTLGSIIDTSEALASETASDELSFDAMMQPSSDDQIDAAFNEIMAE